MAWFWKRKEEGERPRRVVIKSKRGFAPLRAVPQKSIAPAKPALETGRASIQTMCQSHNPLTDRFERGLGPRNLKGEVRKGDAVPLRD